MEWGCEMNIKKQRDALLVLIDENEARIEVLEAALREIEWHDPKSPAAALARAALDKGAGK